jgi:xylulokinase
VQENEPEAARRTARILQSKDYIVGKMTGSFATSDFSDASHAQMLDVHQMTYADTILDALDLDRSLLPELRASTELAGTLCDEAASVFGLPSGIPVSVGGGDGSCASTGAGAVSAGDTYCCFGTTAWISMIADSALIDAQHRVFNIVSLDGDGCGVFGTVQCAGRSIDWMREVFEHEDFAGMDEEVASVAPGAEGLLFLPYLEGERAPIYDSDARGVFFGLTPSHKRPHFLRATVEGVCLGLASVVDILREERAIEAFRIIGGGARSEALRHILASACRAKVRTLSVAAADATALGAAVAAGVGVGLFENLAKGVANIREIDSNAPDSEASEVYQKNAALQMDIYQRLKPLFHAQEQ